MKPFAGRSASAGARRRSRGQARCRQGITIPELLAVTLLIAVVILIGAISLARGKAGGDQLGCQDNMRAIHSSLQTFYTKNGRTYPADQQAFEEWLSAPAYFTEEPRCPLDDEAAYHYLYSYDPATDPGPEGITITCPVPGSGHGSIPTPDGRW